MPSHLEDQESAPNWLDLIDGLNARLRWSLAVASLIACYDDTDDAINDSAESIAEHIRESRRMVRELHEYIRSKSAELPADAAD